MCVVNVNILHFTITSSLSAPELSMTSSIMVPRAAMRLLKRYVVSCHSSLPFLYPTCLSCSSMLANLVFVATISKISRRPFLPGMCTTLSFYLRPSPSEASIILCVDGYCVCRCMTGLILSESSVFHHVSHSTDNH